MQNMCQRVGYILIIATPIVETTSLDMLPPR